MAQTTVTCQACNHQSPTFSGSSEEIQEQVTEWEHGHEQVMHSGEHQDYATQGASS